MLLRWLSPSRDLPVYLLGFRQGRVQGGVVCFALLFRGPVGFPLSERLLERRFLFKEVACLQALPVMGVALPDLDVNTKTRRVERDGHREMIQPRLDRP